MESLVDHPDTLIVNETAADEYRDYYHPNRFTYVEHPGFIAQCIDKGRYRHELPGQKPMGGRQPGYKCVICEGLVGSGG